MGIKLNIKKTIAYLKRNGLSNTITAVLERLSNTDNYKYRYNEVDESEILRQKKKVWKSKCKFSIITPIFNPAPEYMIKMIESVLNQSYDDYELILVDASNSSYSNIIKSNFNDERIQYYRIDENKGIAENTNVALNNVSGDYVILMDHDDIITNDALYEMAIKIEESNNRGVRPALLYSDEDKYEEIKGADEYSAPHYKEELNLDLLMTNNYISHLTAIDSKICQDIRFRSKYDGAQDYDYYLRVILYLVRKGIDIYDSIIHIPKVLYHWRIHDNSTASNPASKNYAYEAGRRAVQDFINEYIRILDNNIHADVIRKEMNLRVTNSKHLGFYRVEYGDDIFSIREDIGAVGGKIVNGKSRIVGGLYSDKGNVMYYGLRSSYSGYMNRAAMQQTAYALDIRNIQIAPKLASLVNIYLERCGDIYKEYNSINANECVDIIENLSRGNTHNNSTENTFRDLINQQLIEELVTVLSEKDIHILNIYMSILIKRLGYVLLWDPLKPSRRYEISTLKGIYRSKKDKDIRMALSTIIIPNYNGRQYVRVCLDSVMDDVRYSVSINPEREYRVIVVDDYSSDGSDVLIKDNYPDVHLHRNSDNLGFAASVNTGISIADTPYVILLNNDTIIKRGFISSIENSMHSGRNLFSISAKMLEMDRPSYIDGAGDLYCALGWAIARGKGKRNDTHYNRRDRIFSACAGAAIYNRSILLKLGGFDDKHFAYLEDVDIGYRARIYGYTNLYEPNAVVLHKGSATMGGRYSDFKVRISARNNLYMIIKNMPPLQLLFNLPLIIVGMLIKTMFFVNKGYVFQYIKGNIEGIMLSYNNVDKRVKFKWKNIGNYMSIELELLTNCIRAFKTLF